MKIRKVFLQGIAICLVWMTMLTHSLAATEPPAVWRFGLEEIEGSVQDIYAQAFKKKVEDKSQGEVVVDIYSYGMLGESEDLTALTAIGTLQLTHASMGIIGAQVPEMQVFTIPYLFSADDELNQRVLSSNPTLYEILGNALIDQDLRLMTIYLEGDMVWSTNKLIRKPRDFNQFKMRVMNSSLVIETFKLFGAQALPLPYSQVYGSLQARIIDGQSNPIFSIEEMKFYEVTEYLIWSGQQKFTTSVLANQAWYLTLSSAHKRILSETIEELSPYIFEQQTKLNKAQLKTIKESKPSMTMVTLTKREKAAFKKASDPIRKQYIENAGEAGKRLLEALEADFNNVK
ncbi:C4-dicarboxylate ABC transporter [Enterovibrio norvegicus FF-162]|uniref:TRAP transporter substrate-binding protein DctP n=1 Tax=Enterovibrio norvegicus TaxID=188144 RepID=UPI0002E67C99|nr:TRAP transporter substrate-binding protein DctP [Enterovibrio norvegicus]OEE76582.1 C4-dicarboxylate ABC transporter [Enterovibrio norvegicus FF-162]